MQYCVPPVWGAVLAAQAAPPSSPPAELVVELDPLGPDVAVELERDPEGVELVPEEPALVDEGADGSPCPPEQDARRATTAGKAKRKRALMNGPSCVRVRWCSSSGRPHATVRVRTAYR
jgi:hypothetical protein